tara:strand:+ start:832 stop:1371 length:540 start_codon:yes stop_codon:yes gene_type:complete
MDTTNIGYPHDDKRFQKEVHQMTESEVDAWLSDIPNEPAPADSEPYENFMQRQAYYTKYLNMVIVARDEYRSQGDKLAILPPPVGEDIVEVVEWIQRTGETPIEYLTKTYRSSSAKTQDRITAARALMDYVHRKMPHTIDVKDDRKNKDTEASQLEMLKKVEELLSGAIQEKKKLQRVK